jgi:isopenicillin N synthase-like dioxygenase
MRNNIDISSYHRGYEPLCTQNFEKQTKGDLKEGFYLGKDLLMDDPYIVAGKFSQGPNKYPHEVRDSQLFRKIIVGRTGIGAHTDFGAVTILLQDAVGGLQVWDRTTSQWAEVAPHGGALVVNLGT